MSSDPQNRPAVRSDSDSQGSQQSQLTPVNQPSRPNLYRSQTTPLPGNRPIADNATEEIDEMLGYLD